METKPLKPPVAPHRKRRLWLWLGFVALCTGAVVLWLADGGHTCAQSTQQSGQRRPAGSQIVPVAATKAVTGDVPVFLDGLGSVSPFYTVTIRTRVDGQLMTVSFQEG